MSGVFKKCCQALVLGRTAKNRYKKVFIFEINLCRVNLEKNG